MIDLANDPLYKAAVAKHWADKKAAAETPLAKFLEPSEVKQRMYHGTGQDIRQFKPKQAGASFVTPDPKFAHDFADLSESWMKRNVGTILTGEQIQRAKDLVAQDLNRRARALMHDSPNGEVARIGSPQASEFSKTQYANRLAEQLPSAQNIMPVHVQAKKPFDYENPKHVHAVRTMLHKLGHTQHIDDFDTAMRGGKGDDANWHTIESKPVQQAIRALGHDSFWVKEGGVKNLGVYNPGAIKSAIGNRGTYDTEDYDVNKAQGGAVHLAAGKSVEPPPYRVYRGTTAGTMLSNAPYTHFAHKPEVAAGAERGYLSPEFLQSVGMDPALARVPKDLAVYPADVRIRKPAGPKEVNKHAPNAKTVQEAFPILHKAGYDGYVDNYQVVPFEHHQIKSAFEKAQGGAVKPVKLKEGQQPPYQDPKTSKIDDWKWHPMERIRQELSARRELPEHVTPYADYMREMNAKAQAGKLTPRDLVKAYTITQSSIGRGGLSHSMATSRGMKLPKTGGEVRPEGAFAEWLGSPMGQKYLDASMRGEDHPEAMEDLRAKFAPFGKQNAQVEAMQYATKTLPQRVASANYAVTGGKDDYRKFAGNIRGIAGAKSGFIGSLLGRGDLPTLDARQLNLHSLSHPTKTPEGMMSRGKGLGGQEAVDRLIARQDALGYKIPKELAPYAQHLIHHDVWDQRGGTKTTHEDLIKAMRGYADGGDVEKMRRKLARSQPTGHLGSTPLKPNPAIGSRYAIEEATGLTPKTPVDLEQHKGASVMMLPWDSTSRNVAVRGISGRKLPKPVVTHGGQDYARDLEHIAQGVAGASGEDIAKRIATRESIARMENEQAGGTGSVLHLPSTMGPRAEDFSMTPTEILHHFVRMAKLPQSELDRMNQQIRQHKIIKNKKLVQPFTKFVGLTDPKFYQQIHTGEGLDTTAGELRKAITDRLGYLKENQKALGFNMEDIVSAITDPALRGVPKGYVGNTVIGSDPDQMTLTPSKNKAYDTNFSGRYLGTLGSSFPAEVLFKQHMANLSKEFAGKKGDIRNMALGALEKRNEGVSQMLNNQTLDEYGKYLMERDRVLKQGKYAKGGSVSMDEMLAHTTLGKKAPNVRNIGADEAPDMKVKQYIPPGPSNGLGLPAGGVDFQPEMPGQQLSQAVPAGPGGPAMPGMPGMPPGAPGMPPGAPGPGMPGMPPPLPRNQPGMPTGKPAGLEPPNIPPPKQKPTGSNILSMTPQGQALAALGPMRKMADGGPVASRAFQEVEAPKKTTKAYKLFRTHPKHPGKLFPLFVDANEPVEQGKWLAAQAGESAGEKVKSKIGPLAYRPGWHGGDLPIATHIGSKSTSRLKKPDIRPDNHVWTEVEMPNDVDWHSEAQRRGTNAQGRVVPVKSHITDQVPTGGHYRYKTNANMTGNWLIGGSMKVNRVLPDKEVAAINKAAGVADLPRQQPQDLSKLGFGKTKVTLPPSTEQMRQALSARRSNSKA